MSNALGTATAAGLGARRAPATRLGVSVVHDLVAAVVTGVIAPGDLLPTESALCEHFGVSRTIIRESVKRLEEKGLVSVVQGRGTQVTDPEDWNILDGVVLSAMIEHDAELGILDELAVVRSQLESVMSGRAARSHSDDDIASLVAAHEHLVTAQGNPESFSQADVDFHSRIMEISGDRLAQGIARTLTKRAREYTRFHGAPGPDAFQLTIDEHQRVLDAIAAGDPEAAGAAMASHISQAWERRRLPRGASD